VRLLLMQRSLDKLRGWNTAGFVSGYRGSPLGGVDQQLWRAQKLLDASQIRFLPAINEELAGTAILGTQRVEADPERTVDGVFAMWYGKGPGVDRAGDALRHGNAYGGSPHGGVLVVTGDDHGCVSSSMPHQSEWVMMAWRMPVLNPASVAEIIEFGLYGWQLSRFSGAWVALKAISETVESAATVDLGAIQTGWSVTTEYQMPSGGLHNRWPDLPSVSIEARSYAKLEAVAAFARANSIDRLVAPSPAASVGIVTCGKAHLDLLEALRRLDLTIHELDAAGVRIYKVGLSFPLETTRVDTFAQGLTEILVVEEKGAFVENQLRTHFYNRRNARPTIIGKTDADGASLLAAVGELRPSRVMPVFARWLARHRPALDRRDRVVDFVAAAVLSNIADGVQRSPYFCSGCPHNTSTRIPEGSTAQAGIGCHFMASWMERQTVGLIQMGGEGVDWAAHCHFTRTPHIFQNLGDGTYFHSGVLAIRQSIAAGSNITYKILYNDAVAMTGGQPVDGSISVPQIARQVEAEGVSRLAVVSDDPGKYRGHEDGFPRGTSFHDRSELDKLQREMREIKGVSVLIYDQRCAAELRRDRKRGKIAEPARRIFINAEVCEGCGDCGVQSNCLSVEPVETPFGRKRAIDQTSCNKDYSCVKGFCPSFVSLVGAKPRRAVGAEFDARELATRVASLPMPSRHLDEAPYDLLVAGVGGTGIVTVGAIVAMAAHLEGRSASVLDFMGFAQKGGAVLSFVRFADRAELLNQARIDTQQADFILACDLVVGAAQEALQTVRHGRTRILVNEHEIATDAFVRHADAKLHAGALLDKMRHAAGAERLVSCDAHALAHRFLGETMAANIVLLGFAWQSGGVPVSLLALDRALELNGVAVAANRLAFSIGRMAAADPAGLEAMCRASQDASARTPAKLDDIIEMRSRHLMDYQGVALANRYRAIVATVREAEERVMGQAGPLSSAVAENLAKLVAYKDEYEVARLYCDGQFERALAAEFEGRAGRDYRVVFHMAPPLLAPVGIDGRPRKLAMGPWLWPLLRLLSKMKSLRGTVLDPFGWPPERQVERQLAREYSDHIVRLAQHLTPPRFAASLEWARLPEQVRGFGPVKLESLVRERERNGRLLDELGEPHAETGPIAKAIARMRNRGRVIAIQVAR